MDWESEKVKEYYEEGMRELHGDVVGFGNTGY